MTVKTPISTKTQQIRQNSHSSIHSLREENSRLRTDVSRLRIEKAQLKEVNSQLRMENIRLKEEVAQLKEELYFTQEELKEERDLSEQKDLDIAMDNALYQLLEEEHLRLQFD